MLPPIDEITANFEALEDPNDRLEYLIELGRLAEALPDEHKTEDNRVRGCASQVWLRTSSDLEDGRRVMRFEGDSDAIITRGIVALIAALHSGRTAQEIERLDALQVFRDIGIGEHLTAQRSNGARSMIDRIKADARRALATA